MRAVGLALVALCASAVFAVEVRVLPLDPQAARVSAVAIDSDHRFAYFALAESDFSYSLEGLQTTIIKVRLDDFVRAATIRLRPGDNPVSTITPFGSNEVYFGIFGDSNRDVTSTLIQVDARSGKETGRQTFGAQTYGVESSVTDGARRAAYFGTAYGMLVGVDLSSMTVLGRSSLQKEDHAFTCAAVDPAGRFAYFATSSGNVMKIELDHFTPAADLSVEKRNGAFRSAVLDPSGRYLYLGTQKPARVTEIDLQAFRVSDTFELPQQDSGTLVIAGYDSSKNALLFASDGKPSRLYALGIHPLRMLGQRVIPASEGTLTSGAYDDSRHVFYLGLRRSEGGQLMRVAQP